MVTERTIIQIGNAGAFDFGKTASSFFIKQNNTNLLIDCGHGVNKWLQDNEKIRDIDGVFITHTHFDHIADLEALIYFRYFILNKLTRVYSAPNIIAELKNIFGKRFDSEYFNGENTPAKMVVFEPIDNVDCLLNKFNNKNGVYYANVNHGNMNAVGFVFRENNHGLIVSGDTKACSGILKALNTLELSIDGTLYQKKHITLFHDYSNFNNPLKNVHMCEYDCQAIYENFKKFKNKDNIEFSFFKYHDGSELKSTEW